MALEHDFMVSRPRDPLERSRAESVSSWDIGSVLWGGPMAGGRDLDIGGHEDIVTAGYLAVSLLLTASCCSGSSIDSPAHLLVQ